LGGGPSIVSSVVGYGSDQIVSARMIDAKGELVVVSEEMNQTFYMLSAELVNSSVWSPNS
jgi:hypothetical protein